MSVRRDLLSIAIYTLLLTLLLGSVFGSVPPNFRALTYGSISAVSKPLAVIVYAHLGLASILYSVQNRLGFMIAWIAAFLIVLTLYLVSWFLTEVGRTFIQSWGQMGGPSVGVLQTWEHCIKANVFYLLAWWLCPINHRPLSNLVYNFNLMRFWPLTVPLIILTGAILPAPLSGHYQDVFMKVFTNYPYLNKGTMKLRW